MIVFLIGISQEGQGIFLTTNCQNTQYCLQFYHASFHVRRILGKIIRALLRIELNSDQSNFVLWSPWPSWYEAIFNQMPLLTFKVAFVRARATDEGRKKYFCTHKNFTCCTFFWPRSIIAPWWRHSGSYHRLPWALLDLMPLFMSGMEWRQYSEYMDSMEYPYMP